jgi:hypothetical protein
MLGLAGLLAAGAAGVQAKAKIIRPNFAGFGLVTNLDTEAGTFVLHRPRGPLSKRDTTIVLTDQTVFVDTKHKTVTDNSLAEGQLVQVAGFKVKGESTVTAAQVAIVTNPTTTPSPF